MIDTTLNNDRLNNTNTKNLMVGSQEQIKELELKAEQENVEAQYKLAVIYEKNANYRKAAFWYRKAAMHSLARAQDALAKFYYLGYGLKQNFQKAAYWHRKAAEQGYSYSQLTLAKLYKDGEGVVQNYQKCVYWYEKAADQNELEAQYDLAVMYEQGEGVVKDLNKAIYWYEKAANLGYTLAEQRLTQLKHIIHNNQHSNLESKYQINSDFQARLFLTPSDQVRDFIVNQDSKKLQQLMENIQVRATKYEDLEEYECDFLKKHSSFIITQANNGDFFAQFALAQMYENGYLVDKDVTVAFDLYKKSAMQDFHEAQFHLALMYDLGLGVESDLNQAFIWYEKAAEQGNDKAMYNLANMYFNAKGCTKDINKAIELYEKAASLGNQRAQGKLAIIYDKGEDVAQDSKKAQYWYDQSVSSSNNDKADPILSVAFMSLYNKDSELDYKKATALFKAMSTLDKIGQYDVVSKQKDFVVDNEPHTADEEGIYTEYSNDFRTGEQRHNPKDLAEALAYNFKQDQSLIVEKLHDEHLYSEFSNKNMEDEHEYDNELLINDDFNLYTNTETEHFAHKKSIINRIIAKLFKKNKNS